MGVDAVADVLAGIRGVGWRDVIDITVVAFLIYEFLKLIRHSRAVQIVFGGALVVGIYYASEIAALRTVNWLIGDMLGYIVFAAIVLFQADIRRGLSRLGRAPGVRYLARRATTDETLEEVVTAAGMLAEAQVGALIVIERGIGLRNYVDSGILLDSRVTYDLIVSIFQTDSPLHDGAVVIQDDRIAAAACFLPLTVSPQRTHLGTRHRAAIGLTEETDAVAIVVSEETGAVSIAVDGRIERDLDEAQRAVRLDALVRTDRRRRSGPGSRGGGGGTAAAIGETGRPAPADGDQDGEQDAAPPRP